MGKVKLNIGSRNTRIPGFKNIDIDAHDNVDLVCDVSNLQGVIGSNTVDEILASHILEHFPHIQTKFILKEWHRVIKPGGIIWISVPDFDRIVEIYIREGLSDWIVNMLYGDQQYKTAYHYEAFNFTRLKRLLAESGFDKIERLNMLPKEFFCGCASLVNTSDRRTISLNIKAVKPER